MGTIVTADSRGREELCGLGCDLLDENPDSRRTSVWVAETGLAAATAYTEKPTHSSPCDCRIECRVRRLLSAVLCDQRKGGDDEKRKALAATEDLHRLCIRKNVYKVSLTDEIATTHCYNCSSIKVTLGVCSDCALLRNPPSPSFPRVSFPG